MALSAWEKEAKKEREKEERRAQATQPAPSQARANSAWEKEAQKERAKGNTLSTVSSPLDNALRAAAREASRRELAGHTNRAYYSPTEFRNKQEYDNWRSTVRDTNHVEEALAELDEQISKAEREKAAYASGAGYARRAEDIQALNEKRSAAEAQLNELLKQRDLLREELDYSKYFSYDDLAKNVDFAEKSKAGETQFGDNFFERITASKTQEAYDYINNIDGYRDSVAEASKAAEHDVGNNKVYDYMTEEQIATFNYVYHMQGEEAAEAYLNWLKDNRVQMGLNAQYGKDLAEDMNKVESVAQGFKANVNRFGEGVASIFTGERPTSAIQYANEYAKENLGTFGRFANDALGVVGYMAPSILVSAVLGPTGLGLSASAAGAIGSATLGASAGGNAYNQALREGKSKAEAATYGTLIGAAEGGLQYLLGGIGKLGGVADDALLAKVNMIDNAFLRMSATGAVKLGSEVLEEELQNYIEPTLRSIIFEEKFNAPNAQELIYTALLTAVTTGLMESSSITDAGLRNARMGAQFKSMGDESVQAIIEEGLASGEDTKAYKLALELQKAQEEGKAISDDKLGTLYNANVRAVGAENAAQETAEATPEETLMDAAMEAVGVKNEAQQTAEYGMRNVLNIQQKPKTVDSGYGEYGSRTFNEIVEQTNQTPDKVRMEFQSAYEAGLTNLPRERISTLTNVQESAYNAGRQDAIMSMKKAEIKGATVWGKEGGLIQNEYSKKLEAKTSETLQQIGKATGTKIIIEAIPAELNANGYYKDSNGTIHLDVNTTQPIMTVVKHELTHRMQALAPKEYEAFRNYAVQTLSVGLNYGNLTPVEAMQQDYYERSGGKVRLSAEEAMDELAANFTEKILTDENALHDFVTDSVKTEDKRTMAQKFFDAVREFVAKIKAVFNGDKAKMDAEAKREFGATVEQLERAEQLWKENYKAATKAAQSTKNEPSVKSEKAAASMKEGVLTRTIDADGTNVLTTANDNPVAQMDDKGSAVFSLKTYEAFGRAELKRWLDLRVSKNLLSKADAADIVRQLDEYFDLCQQFKNKYAPFGAWSEASVVTDNKGKPVFSVVKANGEYAMNLDFSLVCKKRRTLDAVFGEMIKRGIMDFVGLEEADIVKINDIIRDNGFETACALCFVDSKRYRQAKVADSFVSQYNELVRMLVPEGGEIKAHHFDFVESGHYKAEGTGLHTVSNAELSEGIAKLKQVMRENGSMTVAHKIAKHLLNTPKDRRLVSRSEFMNTDGFGAVKLKNPQVMKLYNSSKGSGGPKAAFSDVQYLGEILKKNNFTPARAYAVGGVRIQSFSDYIPRLVFDYMQMVADLSAKKLPAHAYTKEATFVKQFGMTGIKMNMSLVPDVAKEGVAPGLDKNGNYIWKDGQSFGSDVGVKGSGQTGFDLAIQIQNAEGYSQHCGTIAVGVSKEHITKMLGDENIRMVIPYHKSSLNHIVAMLNNIDKFTDYTGVQNTRNADGKKISGKDFNFNEALIRLGDAKAAANEYLTWCRQNNYIPKFDEFAYHENYYKLLEDFSTYDNGVAAPQGAVTMTFPKEGDAFGSMAELIEQGLDEDAVLEGRRDKSLSSIVDQVEGVLKKENPDTEAEGFYDSARFSLRVTDKKTLDFLDNQDTVTTYKTMQLVDGKLYPPMASRIEGNFEDHSELGTWEQATEHPELIRNGNKFKLDKGKGQGSLEAAYNPYMHSSNLVLNDQFSGAYKRDNLVTVECEVPVSELTSGYHAQFAKDSVGWHPWHTGTVAGQLRHAKGTERQVLLSRWIKPVRIVPDAEVAAMYKELLDGTDIEVPDNVVTPMLLHELKKAGVKIKESGRIRFSMKSQRDILRENAKLKEVNEVLREQFKVSKFAKVEKKALDKFAKQLLKDYNSGADINETRNNLDTLFTYIANGDELGTPSWETAYRMAYDAATEILESAVMVNDEMAQAYSDLRHILRTQGVSISAEYNRDLGGYESIKEFKKANRGRIKIDDNATPVDMVYQELAGSYPEFFDADEHTHPADQLLHIEEVLDQLEPYEYNPHEHHMREASTWLANDIMDRFFDLPQAHTFADKAERKLTEQKIKDGNKLAKLREQKNERISKLIAENREKVNSVREKERARREAQVREIKEHYQAKERKMSESKKARILREKILRHIQPMKQKLLRPSDKQHVPQELRDVVAELLDAINLESTFDIDPATGKRVAKGAGSPTKRTEAFISVKEQYEAIKGNETIDMVVDPALLGNEFTRNLLDEVIAMRDVPLNAMNAEQLQTIWDVVRTIEHSILTAGRALSNSKYATRAELVEAFQTDTASRKPVRTGNALNSIAKDLETPYTFFSYYGQAGLDFYRALRNAQDAEQVMQDELAAKVQAVVSKEQLKKFEKESQVFTTVRGDKVTLSKAHVMEIYLLNKREQAKQHLLGGGIVQPEIGKIKRGDESVLLTELDIGEMIASLSEDEKAIADAFQKLTLLLAEWGNKASMQVYGYEKFTDPDYWTIRSASEQIKQTVEKNRENPRSIANMGSAKALNPLANNALEIGGIFDTFTHHASEMLTYSAWLGTMEDANSIFNFKLRDDDGNVMAGKTMQTLLNRYGGSASTKYWLELMKDIQNGIRGASDSWFGAASEKVIGNVRKASVAGNLRVVIQQPTAYLRALAVLDIDSVMVALGKDVAVKPMFDGWKKAVEHAPIAARKAAGGFEIGNSPTQLAEVLYAPATKGGKAMQALKEAPFALPSAADQLTWGSIWNACEHQIGKTHKELKKGSAEYNEAVAELFTDVIDQTQVVDGVLQRSQAMRSGNGAVKQMTAFMGEPTINLNLVMRTYNNFRHEVEKETRNAARKKLGRAVTGVMTACVVNAFAQSIVDGLRDDDDEKEYWERVWANFVGLRGDEETWAQFAKAILLDGNLGNNLNPASWVIYLKDLLSLLQGYSIERMDASAIGDFMTAVSNVGKSIRGEGKWTAGYAAMKAVTTGAKLCGSSLGNIVRDVESIIRSIGADTDDIEAQYDVMKLMYNPKKQTSRFLDLLYKASKQGDDEMYDRIAGDLMREADLKEEDIESAVEDRRIDEELAALGYKQSKLYYDDMFAKALAGDIGGYNKMFEDMVGIGVSAKSIYSAMRSRATAAELGVDDINEALLAAGVELKYDIEGEEGNSFSVDILTPQQAVQYNEELSETAMSIINALGIEGMDEETANELLSAAYDYASTTALLNTAGAEIVTKTEIEDGEEVEKAYISVNGELYSNNAAKWVLFAQDADEIDLTVPEFIALKQEYGTSAMTSADLYNAYDAGIEAENWLRYNEAQSKMKPLQDDNGKNISSSWYIEAYDYINDMGLPDDERDALMAYSLIGGTDLYETAQKMEASKYDDFISGYNEVLDKALGDIAWSTHGNKEAASIFDKANTFAREYAMDYVDDSYDEASIVEKTTTLHNKGIDFDTIFEAMYMYGTLDAKVNGVSVRGKKKERFYEWMYTQGLTYAQREAIWKELS